MNATVTSIKEQQGKYGGMEKVCSITLDDGNNTTVYVKDKAHWVYNDLKPGVYVELKGKDNGPGYLIQKVLEEQAPATSPPPAAPNGQAPARAGRVSNSPTPEEIATYIENKAGQVAHAYQSLKQHFAAIGEEFTPELFASSISTVIISLDKHFAQDAGAWGDSRPLLVAGSPEWDKVIAAIQKHGAGTVDKVVGKARVTPMDEEYLRAIEKQATE